MAFDLHIVFGGICIFVPTTEGKTYVLMPGTESDCALDGGVHSHVARLCWEKKYERMSGHPKFGRRPIEGRELDLTGLVSEQPVVSPPLPDEIVDLKACAQAELIRGVIDGRDAVPLVIESRVVLRGGCVTGMYVADWNLDEDGPLTTMANLVRWTIRGVEGDELPLSASLLRASGGASQPLVTLRPSDGEITMYIVHITPAELEQNLGGHGASVGNMAAGCLPGLLGLGSLSSEGRRGPIEVQHFAVYYCSFATSKRRPLPWSATLPTLRWLQRERCDEPFHRVEEPRIVLRSLRVGFEQTCMTGKTPPPR